MKLGEEGRMATKDPESIYIDFASKISFLEFIQDEFRPAKIPLDQLDQEISSLKPKKLWNIDELSEFVKNYPKSFIIFEQVFQLLRFTNAQLIHFIFDVDKLNSLNINAIYEYMLLNLKNDEKFRQIYLRTINSRLTYEEFIKNIGNYNKKSLVAVFKFAVSKYVDEIIDDFTILKNRIVKAEFADFSIRFSNYLLNNLKLNETLSSIDIEKYLKNKRIPIDTKSLHGNYPRIRIEKILQDNNYKNIDPLLKKYRIKTLESDLSKQINVSNLNGCKVFCTEKYVKEIIKINNGKLKKFDLVIFNELKPKYLFEMNFYTTEGTKVGINEGEYRDLNNYIKENFSNYKFYWITDGNYWLTSQGKNRFLNLINYFETILNINLFAEQIEYFK
ncbi:MAG: hypothetical protein COZ65_00350 [Caldiserica bacterium CG_4_8_14_3_um_filter_35_18]|nr:MAG: hypothetical protein COZ65_00350 [Caldiserica bacterium CG_4_8_14_3_um_filter_35_18]